MSKRMLKTEQAIPVEEGGTSGEVMEIRRYACGFCNLKKQRTSGKVTSTKEVEG